MAAGNTDPIVISIDAKFHQVREEGWDNKLIQFPKGGMLWGMHLSKQSDGETNTKIKGSLLCYGPISEQCSEWSITFDHAFTLSCKRIGCASPIKKASTLSRRNNVVSAVEWGEQKTSTPENWGIHDNVKLSCHMYITQTCGVDRDALKEAAEPDPLGIVEKNHESSPTSSSSPLIQIQTPTQIENEVLQFFSELFTEESIKYTPESLAAIDKIAQFFCFPDVLDVCRRHLMRRQSGRRNGETEEENSHRQRRFDLHGFDYSGNAALRRQRMRNLSEDDVVSIFQHLCSIAFNKT